MRLCFVALCPLAPATAWAQDASDMATARMLGTEGLRLAEAGNCTEAIDRLTRAEKLFHAPTTLERLGECQVKTGHVVDGTESLRRVARETLPQGSPPAFAAAQARAREALEAALPHLARLRVDVTGAASADITVKVDGQAVSSATLGIERPIDPGSHVVEASAPGFITATSRVKVGEGGSEATSLTLQRDPSYHPVVHRELPPVIAPVTRATRVHWPAGVALGMAGAGLIVGSVFGAGAIIDKNNLVSACGGDACTPAQRGQFNNLSTFATVSNVGFIVAGVCAVVGIVLIAVAPKHTITETALGRGLFVGTF